MTGEWRRPGRHRVALMALALSAALSAPAVAGGAAAADPLDDAKARVAAAQEAADVATARFHEAQTRHAEVVLAIDDLEAAIRSGEQQREALREEVERLAVTAYTTSGASTPLAVLGDDDPLAAARREKLLGDAAGVDNDALDDLAAVVDDLGRSRSDLDRQRADAEEALAAMDAEAADLQRELAAAQEAQADVEEQIRQLEAARQEEERRRLEAEREAREAAAADAAAATETPSPSPSGSSPAPAQAGSLVCPIQGPVSFIDSWGAPRPQGPHMGVDLMAARGSPNVAVVSGEVTMRSPGGLPGLGVHLQGDDGNLYYYFHFDSYEGGARRVAQGEVIGYTGNTGDASGGPTHTHFEVHPGGGGAVNPYPYVAAVC